MFLFFGVFFLHDRATDFQFFLKALSERFRGFSAQASDKDSIVQYKTYSRKE